MTDHTQLRKLAEAAIASQGSAAWRDHYMAYDEAVENPEAVIELLDEIDRLKKDAERYRWLKMNSGVSPGLLKPKLTLVSTCPTYGDEREVTNITAAIDAAMLK